MASKKRQLDKKKITYGPDGRPVCTYCNGPVLPPRRTFCSQECVDAYMVRRSPAYARSKVAARDKGVCAQCGLDTIALELELSEMSGPDRRQRRKELGIPEHRVTLWDMDHILPVKEGGGQCDLSNLTSLCINCHRVKTEAAARKRY